MSDQLDAKPEPASEADLAFAICNIDASKSNNHATCLMRGVFSGSERRPARVQLSVRSSIQDFVFLAGVYSSVLAYQREMGGPLRYGILRTHAHYDMGRIFGM